METFTTCDLFYKLKNIDEVKVGDYILGSEKTKAYYPREYFCACNLSPTLHKVIKINKKSIVVVDITNNEKIRVEKMYNNKEALVWIPREKLAKTIRKEMKWKQKK